MEKSRVPIDSAEATLDHRLFKNERINRRILEKNG